MPVDETQLRTGAIEIGTHINCYRNLNLLKYGIVGWSIQRNVKNEETKKSSMLVVQHAKCVLLSDVAFKAANETQVKRVMETCREVCAWLKGKYEGSCLSRGGSGGTWDSPPAVEDVAPVLAGRWRQLRCDPKKGRGDFYDAKTEVGVIEADFVFIDNESKAWYIPKQ